MLFRPRRDGRGPDRFLGPKMVILGIGGLVAVIGFSLDIEWLVTVAIFILVVGLGLNLGRAFGRSGQDSSDASPPSQTPD